MPKDFNREKIYLAALLHDIGKFWQRADEKRADGTFEQLKAELWNSEVPFCPEYKGHYSHKHVLWTAQFFDDHRSVFREQGDGFYENDDSITRTAALHHKPSTIEQKIVQLADWFSSGVDRSSDEYSMEDGLSQANWKTFKEKRMVSIFETIGQKQENKIEQYKYSLPVVPLELNDSFFPRNNFDLPPDYKKQWKLFTEDFK